MAYHWVNIATVKRHEALARSLGVSTVARSPRGFLRAYQAAGGSARAMNATRVPGYPNQTWGQRRNAYIARHLPQYRQRPTERRRLALMVWAYQV
jgi:hypothetical protein